MESKLIAEYLTSSGKFCAMKIMQDYSNRNNKSTYSYTGKFGEEVDYL